MDRKPKTVVKGFKNYEFETVGQVRNLMKYSELIKF